MDIGQIIWIIAQLTFGGALIRDWFVNDKISTIYILCVAIGFMLIANHM